MKRYIPSILISIFSVTLFAMPTDSVFIHLPDNILPTLGAKQRFEMTEYFKAGKADSTQNLFGKNAVITLYDTLNCHIRLVTSATGTTEIKRFYTADNSEIYGVINTVNTPVKTSSVCFYNANWRKLKYKIILPESGKWIDEEKCKTEKADYDQMKNIVRIAYYSLRFDADNQLIIENNTLSTLSEEDRKKVEKVWNEKSIKQDVFNLIREK